MPQLVSVVIPCRDGERYLAQAISSVLGQTWTEHEVFVVDDGSKDRSAEIAEGFGPAVRLLRQAPAGAGAARNAGLELARGSLIAFIDADDVWPQDSLEARVAALASDPRLDLVTGRMVQFLSPDLPADVRARIRCPEGSSHARLPGTVLARRTAFDRVGGFSTDVVVGEPLDWFLRAHEVGLRRATVDKVVLRRRLHGSSLGAVDRDARRADYLRVVKEALDRRRRARAGRTGWETSR